MYITVFILSVQSFIWQVYALILTVTAWMENKDLREQFQLLQEQQQQKLLERRKKKEQANKNKEDKTDSKNDSSSKFGVSDDLGLKVWAYWKASRHFVLESGSVYILSSCLKLLHSWTVQLKNYTFCLQNDILKRSYHFLLASHLASHKYSQYIITCTLRYSFLQITANCACLFLLLF